MRQEPDSSAAFMRLHYMSEPNGRKSRVTRFGLDLTCVIGDPSAIGSGGSAQRHRGIIISIAPGPKAETSLKKLLKIAT